MATDTTRPPCDLRGISDPTALAKRVAAVLRLAHEEASAVAFLARAETVRSANAVMQIARDYVEPVVWQ